MNTRQIRVTRKARRGGVIDYHPSIILKSGLTRLDGITYSEAADGRIVRMPKMRRLEWDGRKFVENEVQM